MEIHNKYSNIPYADIPKAIAELYERYEQLNITLSKIKSEEGQQNNSERLTRKEIKDLYKISYGTIHKLMNMGKLPYSKISRKTLFLRRDVDVCFGPSGCTTL